MYSEYPSGIRIIGRSSLMIIIARLPIRNRDVTRPCRKDAFNLAVSLTSHSTKDSGKWSYITTG
jgi:hypothetical protein